VLIQPFGSLPDGTSVELYSIANGQIELHAITYGAVITSLRVPDRNGHHEDVVLGHDHLQPYLEDTAYLGAVVGRYANRIAEGRFRLDGVDYRLATNDGPNHLHGGRSGFNRQLWAAQPVVDGKAAGVTFTRTSPSGEEYYPGALAVSISYLLIDDTIVLRYEATTDAPTIVNLTQHTYFNLTGQPQNRLTTHELTIDADEYLPITANLIPTGEVRTVAGTPFDFRTPVALGGRWHMDDAQLNAAGGFDHNYVLKDRQTLAPAAELRDPRSGRTLQIATTEPGLQFYDGHLLHSGHAGLCLETQHFPDSPNRLEFPSVTLRPGQRYRSQTAWRFTTT
jgi:aldose 1-epimerase